MDLAHRVDAAWGWRVGLARRVDPRVGLGSGFCGPFPRMAHGFGAPRGRRVERVPIRLANTTSAQSSLILQYSLWHTDTDKIFYVVNTTIKPFLKYQRSTQFFNFL